MAECTGSRDFPEGFLREINGFIDEFLGGFGVDIHAMHTHVEKVTHLFHGTLEQQYLAMISLPGELEQITRIVDVHVQDTAIPSIVARWREEIFPQAPRPARFFGDRVPTPHPMDGAPMPARSLNTLAQMTSFRPLVPVAPFMEPPLLDLLDCRSTGPGSSADSLQSDARAIRQSIDWSIREEARLLSSIEREESEVRKQAITIILRNFVQCRVDLQHLLGSLGLDPLESAEQQIPEFHLEEIQAAAASRREKSEAPAAPEFFPRGEDKENKHS
jgi:hypothetical protein